MCYIPAFGRNFMALRFHVILVIDHSFMIEISGLVRARATKNKQMRTFPYGNLDLMLLLVRCYHVQITPCFLVFLMLQGLDSALPMTMSRYICSVFAVSFSSQKLPRNF